MKDNNPPEPERPNLTFKISVVKAKVIELRESSDRIVVASYEHGHIFWADGQPVAFLVDAAHADPARKNHVEFAAYCPPDVAAEIGAYCWSRFPEVFPSKDDRKDLFLLVKSIPEILMRIAKG